MPPHPSHPPNGQCPYMATTHFTKGLPSVKITKTSARLLGFCPLGIFAAHQVLFYKVHFFSFKILLSQSTSWHFPLQLFLSRPMWRMVVAGSRPWTCVRGLQGGRLSNLKVWLKKKHFSVFQTLPSFCRCWCMRWRSDTRPVPATVLLWEGWAAISSKASQSQKTSSSE